jgi:hypothetical protein
MGLPMLGRPAALALLAPVPFIVWIACLACPLTRALAAEFRPLEPLAEAKIERIEEFVAADAFRLGNRIGGRTLSAVGLNFARHFLSVVEKDVPATSLRVWTLQYTTGDKSLIKALRGEEHAAVPFLAYIHRVMEMGEGAAGHTDWRSNFAYVRSPIDQRLWAVHWTVNYANEWNIGAVYVPHPHLDWRSGSHFFSDRGLFGKSSCAGGADIRFECHDDE